MDMSHIVRSPEAVEPFLRNLFSDPAIIALPAIIRLPLAWFIAKRRAPVARKIYDHIGGSLMDQAEEAPKKRGPYKKKAA
jgi:protoheme ferro-lyase